MSDLKIKRDYCILCESRKLQNVVALSSMPLSTPNKVYENDLERDAALADVPLDLNLCTECGQLQVGFVGDPTFLYRRYMYTTSLSLGLTQHFERYAREVVAELQPKPGSFVVEIGSNDGTLLRFFKNAGLKVLGVDPAETIAQTATENGIETLADFFGTNVAKKIRTDYLPADIIVANNVIANIDAMGDFADGIRELLAPDGVFVFETQYGADVIERTLLDTIYHEHVSYYMIKPLQSFFARHELEVIDVLRVPTKGGSIRVSVQPVGGPRPTKPVVEEMIREEKEKGIYGSVFYQRLSDDVRAIRGELHLIVEAQRAKGKTVAGYGVSVGTTTLLAQFELTKDIDFLFDDDPNKESSLIGQGYRIPVLARDEIYTRNPGAIIIFAWRFAPAIMAKHQRYIEEGGLFIVPLPKVATFERSGSGLDSVK